MTTTEFKKEQDDLRDLEFVEHIVCQNNFPFHRTLANIVLKVQISEACAERDFVRYRLVHNNLRASLSAEKQGNQLFVRYKFKTILKNANYAEIAKFYLLKLLMIRL